MMRDLICISCPMGCHLTAELQPDNQVIVNGNRCPRGKIYAFNELTDPKRMVTAVIKSNSTQVPCVPVRTSAAISTGKIPELLTALRQVEIAVPIAAEQVVLANFQDTGVDVICTRSVAE